MLQFKLFLKFILISHVCLSKILSGVNYEILSKTFLKPDNYMFINKEMTFRPLSNYEIKIFRSEF